MMGCRQTIRANTSKLYSMVIDDGYRKQNDGLHDTSPIHVGGGDDFGNMSEYGDFDV